MTSRAQELAKLLGSMNLRQPTTFFSSPVTTYNTGEGRQGGIWGVVYVAAIILLVTFAVLLIIHYTITPIFKFKFGDKGYIRIQDTNDGELVWTKGPAPSDVAADFKNLLSCGYTLQQDLFIKPATSVSKVTRVFLYRANNPMSVDMNPTTEDLITQYANSNILMYLSPDTNDLTVSVITGTNDTYRIESAPTILNVPVGKVFRLTVVLEPKLLEIYLNGRLFGSKVLKQTPRDMNTNFYAAPEGIRNTVTSMNLQYWNRILTASEIADAPPALADPNLFGPMPTASCVTESATSIMDTVENSVTSTLEATGAAAQNALSSMRSAI